MKGLDHIPSEKDLVKIYEAFLRGEVSLANIVKASQWSRFDPRLAEIFVTYMSEYWQAYSPMDLRTETLRQCWPSSMGLLLEWIDAKEKKLLEAWKKYITCDIKKALNEQYFIGVYALGSRQMFLSSWISLTPYLKWGYLGNAILNKKLRGKTLVSPEIRETVLSDLHRRSKVIKAEDYRQVLSGAISKRQAQRDLQAFEGFKSRGRTQSKKYIPV